MHARLLLNLKNTALFVWVNETMLDFFSPRFHSMHLSLVDQSLEQSILHYSVLIESEANNQ